MNEDDLLTGKLRPPQIPPEWIGEPMPHNGGWRWSDPANRGNAVRIVRGEADIGSYVVVTVKGNVIGADGQPTGETLND